MTRADNAPALRRSLNGDAPVDDPEKSFLPSPPPTHQLRIRVYDYCEEHGFHTDPELQAREGL
jgi:hypothetical protein